MKVWPVPDSFSKSLPKEGMLGSFWQNRGDRYHCGVDIFAPAGSDVLAIQNGKVIDIGKFTSSDTTNFLNESYYIIIKTSQGINVKYAELEDITVRIGDFVNAGQRIARIAKVLNEEHLSHSTPHYLREMILQGKYSMLHLETYIAPISEVKPYIYGNYVGKTRPFSVIDPALFLNGSVHQSDDD